MTRRSVANTEIVEDGLNVLVVELMTWGFAGVTSRCEQND
jgi:hypothetical protein